MKIIQAVAVLAMAAMLGGCAVNQPGKRTANYGLDGLTVTSETLETPADSLVEIEKEKTRQTCYRQNATRREKMEKMAESNPLVLALISQTDAINNLASLAVTKKSYDPCPSSTNSMDADIAESAMYTSIYHDAIGGLKFLGGMWIGGEVIDNVVSGLAKAGGTSLAASGE